MDTGSGSNASALLAHCRHQLGPVGPDGRRPQDPHCDEARWRAEPVMRPNDPANFLLLKQSRNPEQVLVILAIKAPSLFEAVTWAGHCASLVLAAPPGGLAGPERL